MVAVITVDHKDRIQIIKKLSKKKAKVIGKILRCEYAINAWQQDYNDAYAMFIIKKNIANYSGRNMVYDLYRGKNGNEFRIAINFYTALNQIPIRDGIVFEASSRRPYSEFKVVEIIGA